ncbi:MAG: hypothetical protein Q4D91_02850 [Lautropia sp.]|nr:hypothetical protein [Lautropia sp.]
MSRPLPSTRRHFLRYPLALSAFSTWLTACSSANSPAAGSNPKSLNISATAGSQDNTTALTLSTDARADTKTNTEQAQDYRHRLYTPTFITKIGQRHFIVDCWHHRILHHHDLQQPIQHWHVLDDDLAGPHSIASDGQRYVAEDTGRHRLKVYREQGEGRFEIVQIVDDVGRRPHRVCHDSVRDRFLVVGSTDQSLHIFSPSRQGLRLEHQMVISELEGEYCRSIRLQGERLYFVGATRIVVYRWHGNMPRFTGEQLVLKPLPHTTHVSSNDLFFFEDGRGLLTATPQKAFWFNRLDELATGLAYDVSSLFQGTPYFMDVVDGRLWIPEITESSGLYHYRLPRCDETAESWLSNTNQQRLFDFGLPTATDLTRKTELPT